ncbi:MAG: fluoride efflux transporter CrcB [Streptosporangiales bacterium]|nr:fluoride efflux transporter CrcB [Streptosporangiales bacterium]
MRRHAGVLAVISGGGAVGSVARYLVELALPTRPGSFPWGTFAVNIVGCLLVGLLMVLVTEVWQTGRYLRPFLGVGVLGGFTTFSTLAVETHALAARGQWLLTNVYVVGSVLAGLTAVWVGVILARLLARRPLGRRARR